jgi:hypothetical protein
MAEHVVEVKRQERAASSSAAASSTTPSAPQQKRTAPDIRASLAHGPPRKQAKLAGDRAARLFGVQTVAASSQSEAGEESAYAEARRAVEEFKQHCASLFKTLEDVEGFMKVYPHIKIHTWWAAHRQRFPVMAEVARAVLCITASSGNLERDFCNIRNVVTIRRSSLSPWMVEMLLLCHALHADPKRRLSPDDILALNKAEAEAAKPPRVTKRELLAALADLDVEHDEDAPEVSAVAQLTPWMSLAELVTVWDSEVEGMDLTV